MKLVKISLSIAALALLSACATTVKPTYVSPTLYQTLGCSQLQGEYNRIQQYIDNGVEPPKRTGVGVGVGLGGGWAVAVVGVLARVFQLIWDSHLIPKELNWHGF